MTNPIKMTEDAWEDHFARSVSHEDRSKASRVSSRNGRSQSPSHSAHGSLIRHSILKISDDKKAKKVRFYRNGDRFFKGIIYAVSPERFRTFESLLADLTNSPLGDRKVLPNGVRYVFTANGARKITSLDELEEGENYVCASTELFKHLDYQNSSSPVWNVNIPKGKDTDSTDSSSKENLVLMDEFRDFIKPKLITVVRNGLKPRKAVRVLLNRKTAHSFDQVLTDITEAIKLDSGSVKKIFTLDGRPVISLKDFFGEDTIFVAYGSERYSADDFDLDENEVKLINPYKMKQTERVTLRSPKTRTRRLSSAAAANKSSPTDESPKSPRGSPSPKSPRKQRAFSGPKYRTYNGEDGEFYSEGPSTLAQHYEIGKKIGEGNFAVVKECIDRHSKKRYALKIISKAKCKGKEQMIENEVNILRKVKHINIIQLIEDFPTEDELYLVMELVKGGDLFDAIAMATKYTEKDASGMIYDLANALQHLHHLSIVHRDIKPENLLLCEHGNGSRSLKLGDFGLATYVEEPLYTVCGTPTYVAPEILTESGYGLKVDIWSAGVILYILLCGFPPFSSADNNQEELFDQILDGKYEYPSLYWDDVSSTAKDLIDGMLELDPNKRFSAADVLSHPWACSENAKDSDFQQNIAKGIQSHFKRKPRPSLSSAGIRIVACTALDKDSRYFEGRKAQLTIAKIENGNDEVF
ncbi:hypothetical protein CHS0354_041919 [Potamilus streckersoni]|uniref:Serine/threonine-protein kinase DCLK2 n=1 Tax=Potamilus streckersoni TaxID=2493646 RepID=A0AAE0ST84_9BIVA|nr:hypothetical protein CHS0354_041919 [Potamilus streckersoni]